MYGSYTSRMLKTAYSHRSDMLERRIKLAQTEPEHFPVRPSDEELAGFENVLNTQGRLWAVEEWFKVESRAFDRQQFASWLYNAMYDWNIRPGYTYWFCSEYARWKAKKVFGE